MKRVLVVLVLVAVTSAGGGFAYVERAVQAPRATVDAPEVEVTVPKGMHGRALGKLLADQGLIASTHLWRYHLWRRGGLNAKAGRHLVRASMPIPEIAQVLESPPIPEDEPFVMIEGWRLRDTDAALVEKGWIEPGAYVKAASDPSKFKAVFPLPSSGTLEGYLYPETYRVEPKGFDVHALIQRQLDTFAERFFIPHRAEIEKGKRSLHAVVVMASLLEREEPLPDQRPLVAGILWKRIDASFPLGVDATSRYELAEWNDRRAFLKRLRDEKDPWNTRHKAGLPPGPIGAPTVDSLLAALRPKTSEFWYYLHDAKRTLRPSRNAEEHEALRARYNVY